MHLELDDTWLQRIYQPGFVTFNPFTKTAEVTDGRMHYYIDFESGTYTEALIHTPDTFRGDALCSSPDGRYEIYFAGYGGISDYSWNDIVFYDTQTGESSFVYRAGGSYSPSFAFGPGTELIALERRSVSIYEASTGKELLTNHDLSDSWMELNGVAYDPEIDRYIVVGTFLPDDYDPDYHDLLPATLFFVTTRGEVTDTLDTDYRIDPGCYWNPYEVKITLDGSGNATLEHDLFNSELRAWQTRTATIRYR